MSCLVSIVISLQIFFAPFSVLKWLLWYMKHSGATCHSLCSLWRSEPSIVLVLGTLRWPQSSCYCQHLISIAGLIHTILSTNYQFVFMIYEMFRCQQKWSVDCSYGQPVLLCSSWPVDCGHQGAVWQVWQRAWARMPLHALVCREACSWSSHTQAAATGCALWDQNKGMSCLPFIFYEQRGELSIWCSISLRAWN